MTWSPVNRFAQLKPGCEVRSKEYPNLTGTYRGEGLGYAVIRLDQLDRDSLCRIRDLEVKAWEVMK